jgi:transmembrane sensor
MGRDRWAEALTWYTTLRNADRRQLTLALGRQWQDWYADAENRRVFDAVSRLLADRDHYPKQRPAGKAELQGDSYDLSMSIAEWRRARSKERGGPRAGSGKEWWLLGGLGIAAAIALMVLRPPRLGLTGSRSDASTYQTSVGGMRDIHLRDGSRIVLGGQTSVAVDFSRQRRSVRLIRGEAWFKVAHDPRWPFVVAAGDGTITAVGTAFLVTRESDRVVVTVTEGTVEVSARPPTWPALRLVRRFTMTSLPLPVPVTRGEELAFGESGALRPPKHVDTQAATAWTHGRLTFDDQPLQYVVQTINRYSTRRIVVSPDAGALRFSGIVFDDDIGDWLKSLEVIFPVTETAQGSSVYIRMRKRTVGSR